MTKMLVTGILLIGCGSADTDFGQTARMSVDAGADTRAASGGASGSGGAASGGASVALQQGADPAACLDRCQQGKATWLGVQCDTDVDCCYQTLHCGALGSFRVCLQVAEPCMSDADCPCNRICATYERRSEFMASQIGKCVEPP